MRRKKKCRTCRQYFLPSAANHRRQRSCSRKVCQQQRRREGLKRWRRNNPIYDDNRHEDHRAWREAHRSYWRTYRAQHPAYVRRNRQLQRSRDRKRRHLANRNDWNGLHAEKLKRIRLLGMLANRNDRPVPLNRSTEEICRYLDWRWVLAKRNDLA